jgi:hypothetical protein
MDQPPTYAPLGGFKGAPIRNGFRMHLPLVDGRDDHLVVQKPPDRNAGTLGQPAGVDELLGSRPRLFVAICSKRDLERFAEQGGEVNLFHSLLVAKILDFHQDVQLRNEAFLKIPATRGTFEVPADLPVIAHLASVHRSLAAKHRASVDTTRATLPHYAQPRNYILSGVGIPSSHNPLSMVLTYACTNPSFAASSASPRIRSCA